MRDATERDLPAIVEIYNSTIPGRMATADTEPVSVESRLPWFRAHDPKRRPLLVHEVAGEIAGWISLQDFYGRPAYAHTAEVSVYVAARERGRGHGARMLAEIIQRAPGLGVATLLGFIFAHNAPSLRLFERAGFSRFGSLPRVAELDGIERDLAIVGRRIPSG
jgi:phosphinothricin acetyltransferase